MPRAVSVEPDDQKTAGDSPSTILDLSFRCVSQIHFGQLSRKLQRIFGHTFYLRRGGSSTGNDDTCRQKTVSVAAPGGIPDAPQDNQHVAGMMSDEEPRKFRRHRSALVDDLPAVRLLRGFR